ncbi:aminotransferase class I and II, partial [Reticulomyxa filosa]
MYIIYNNVVYVMQKKKVFSAANRLSVDYLSHGTSVWVFAREQLEKYKCVNHGQGFPDWSSPEFVKKAAQDSVEEDHNQYCSPFGHPLLLEQLVVEYSKKFPKQKLTAKNIQTTIGACGALENCCQAFLNPGDEVITFEPYFDFYKFHVAHAQAFMKTVPVHLNAKKTGWEFDMKAFEQAISKKTKMFILNTVLSPFKKSARGKIFFLFFYFFCKIKPKKRGLSVGRLFYFFLYFFKKKGVCVCMVFTKQQLEEIVKVLKKHPQVIVVSDEVYEDLVYDNTVHHHIANLDDGKMFDRTITISSAAKNSVSQAGRLAGAL